MSISSCLHGAIQPLLIPVFGFSRSTWQRFCNNTTEDLGYRLLRYSRRPLLLHDGMPTYRIHWTFQILAWLYTVLASTVFDVVFPILWWAIGLNSIIIDRCTGPPGENVMGFGQLVPLFLVIMQGIEFILGKNSDDLANIGRRMQRGKQNVCRHHGSRPRAWNSEII